MSKWMTFTMRSAKYVWILIELERAIHGSAPTNHRPECRLTLIYSGITFDSMQRKQKREKEGEEVKMKPPWCLKRILSPCLLALFEVAFWAWMWSASVQHEIKNTNTTDDVTESIREKRSEAFSDTSQRLNLSRYTPVTAQLWAWGPQPEWPVFVQNLGMLVFTHKWRQRN